jgi:aryl-alcohol dehydrogenase-like predicted oxidoreductase
MQTRQIGPFGLEVSALSLGTMGYGDPLIESNGLR